MLGVRQLVEEGTVSKDSLVCICPWPPPDDDAQDKVPPASGYRSQVHTYALQ